ncbi:MAG: hypothetical protein K2N27_11110 [Ruminococcus sp.]|nr:hypothetical protein [Ruminococcus sp.]
MFNKIMIALSSIAVGFVCISGIDIHNNAHIEEAKSISEQAYINENDTFFAENLPYYQKETEKELITVTINPHNNSIIHELKK